MSCDNCTLKDVDLFYDVLPSIFDTSNILFSDSIYNYIPADPDQLEYGVWYPAFIDAQPTHNLDLFPYLGIRDFIKTGTVSFKSFDVTAGSLYGLIPWNLNILGQTVSGGQAGCSYSPTAGQQTGTDVSLLYTEGVLFWYRYWNPDVHDKFDDAGLQIYISDGDFAVINGEPHVTPNLQPSAAFIYSYLERFLSCDNANYLAKLIASGPQIDMITEVLSGSDQNCFASLDENEWYYPRDIYGRLYPFLSKMSDIQYSSVTTNKFVSTQDQLVSQLGAKYGFYVGSNTPFTLLSKFYSESGPNIGITADPEIVSYNDCFNRPYTGGVGGDRLVAGLSYGLRYTVGNLSFTAYDGTTPSDAVFPTGSNGSVGYQSEEPFFYKEFLVNNALIGYFLSTPGTSWLPVVGEVQFHGLGGVKLQNAPAAADGTGLSIRYGVVEYIELNNMGVGYNSAPNVRITGGGGSGAKARAFMPSWGVGGVQVTNGGSGYSQNNPPAVIFIGGGGNGAKATAVINDNGQISEIIINDAGREYEYPPDIILGGASCGTGAVLSAYLDNVDNGTNHVAGIIVTDPGNGYDNPDTIAVILEGGSAYSRNGSAAGGTPANRATATAYITGKKLDPVQQFGLPELSEDNENLCQGGVYPVGSFANAFNKPYVKVAGNAKDALIVNGANASCVNAQDGGRNDTRIKCANGLNAHYVEMQAPSNVEVSVKHNTGSTVSANNVSILYGQTSGAKGGLGANYVPYYRHLKDISKKPHFVPNYPSNLVNTYSIDGPRSKVKLEYYPGPGQSLYIRRIRMRYLRSGLNPACESFIIGGGISGINVVQGGRNYWGDVIISITGGGGSGATATATTNSQGEIESVTITNPGSGYSSSFGSNPLTVTAVDTSGMGEGATFSVITSTVSGSITAGSSGSGTQADVGVVSDMTCSAIGELHPRTHALSTLNNSRTSFVPGTSTYYVPPVYAYGGLSADEVLENGVRILAGGVDYHPLPGTLLLKSHKNMIEEGSGGCSVEYEGCNSDQIIIQVPYSANISAQLTEGAGTAAWNSVQFQILWNGIVVNQGVNKRDPIGILKTLANPSQVVFKIQVPGGSTTPKQWKLEVTVTKNRYEDVVLPMAPSHFGQKGFFHPNLGFTFDQQYLNKTAVIRNHRPDSRRGKYIYDYNTAYLYDNDFLPGYNYMFDFSNISQSKAATLLAAKYIGVPIGTGSYLVSDQVAFRQYLPTTSLILNPVKFDFLNIDSYMYTGDTALNDFTYTKVDDNVVQVGSRMSDERVIKYLSNMPEKIEHGKYILANGTNVNDYRILQSNYSVGNTIYFDEEIPFGGGFISKMPESDPIFESVIVYRPRDTYNDPYHRTGKWGHLSYGDAAIEGLSWYDYRRYNLITLKTMLSLDSGMTWSSPIVFYNNFDSDNRTYYQPLTNKYVNENNVDNYFTLSQNQADFNSRFPDSDLILSFVEIMNIGSYVYIGPYTGPLHIRFGIANVGSINDGEHYIIKLMVDGNITQHDISAGSFVDFYINKNQQTPIYGLVQIEKFGAQCIAMNTRNVSSSMPYITYATVKVNDTGYNTRRKSVISFHKHNTKGDVTEITQDQSVLGPADTVCGGIVSPLQPIPNLFDKSIDFASIMDMHIFSDPNQPAYDPIRSVAGNVYFEDFLQPVPKHIFDSAGYNKDKYWVDISGDSQWKFMSSKGYVFEEGKIYKVLLNLKYGCTDSASQCAGIYNINICENEYSLSIAQMLDLLGITGGDQQYFENQVITFPQGCENIDLCCASRYNPGTFSYLRCIEQQVAKRQECAEFFTSTGPEAETVDCTNIFEENTPPEANPACQEDPPDDDDDDEDQEVGGSIFPVQSTFLYFKVKDNIKPLLNSINSANFLFLPEVRDSNLACSTARLPSLGSVFKFNYFCSTLSDRCDFIIERDFTKGQQFAPGTLLDPSQLFINQTKGQGTIGEPPLDLIYKNEEIYRSIIPAKFPVSSPLAAEYDRESNTNFKYEHEFNVRLDQICLNGAKPLFSISFDGLVCNYEITMDMPPLLTAGSLYLRSNCFGYQELVSRSQDPEETEEEEISVQTVQYTPNRFSCDDPDFVYEDTYATFDPYDHIPEGSELLGVSATVTGDTLLCRYCGDLSCSASTTIVPDLDGECFCPPYATLVEDEENEYNNFCSYPAETIIETYIYYTQFSDGNCNIEEEEYEYQTCGLGRYIYYGEYGDEFICREAAFCFRTLEGCDTSTNSYDEACPDANVEVQWTTTHTEYLTVPNRSQSPAQIEAARVHAQAEINRDMERQDAQCACQRDVCYDNCNTVNCCHCNNICIEQYCCPRYKTVFDVYESCVGAHFNWYSYNWYYQVPPGSGCNESPEDTICQVGPPRSPGLPMPRTCVIYYEPAEFSRCTPVFGDPVDCPCTYVIGNTYNNEAMVKYRTISMNHKQKMMELTYADIKNGTETINQITRRHTITFIPPDDDTQPSDPNKSDEANAPRLDCPCTEPTKAPNLTIKYTKFKNFIQIDGGLSGDHDKQVCVTGAMLGDGTDLYAPFKCPLINFQKYDSSIIMTDSVNTFVTSCYAGWTAPVDTEA